MPINQICARLIAIYKAKPQQRLGENIDLVLQQKVKVIRFIIEWYDASRETFFEDSKINTFLDVRHLFIISDKICYFLSRKKELQHLIRVDVKVFPQLKEEIKLIEAINGNDA
jgi:hypothetical protein